MVIILPGLMAILPWALWLASKVEKLDALYTTYGVLANALLVGVGILVGAIAESALTNLEVRWDNERENEYQVTENWYAYLALQPIHEPVGFRYISRTVTTMYFEMSLMVASPPALIGLSVLTFNRQYPLWWLYPIAFSAGAVYCAFFFYKCAKDTHLVLCKVRRELVKRIIKPGTPSGHAS
jgi:hypothetical protein